MDRLVVVEGIDAILAYLATDAIPAAKPQVTPSVAKVEAPKPAAAAPSTTSDDSTKRPFRFPAEAKAWAQRTYGAKWYEGDKDAIWAAYIAQDSAPTAPEAKAQVEKANSRTPKQERHDDSLILAWMLVNDLHPRMKPENRRVKVMEYAKAIASV